MEEEETANTMVAACCIDIDDDEYAISYSNTISASVTTTPPDIKQQSWGGSWEQGRLVARERERDRHFVWLVRAHCVSSLLSSHAYRFVQIAGKLVLRNLFQLYRQHYDASLQSGTTCEWQGIMQRCLE